MSPFRFARRYRSTPVKASPMKAFTPRIEQLEDRSVPATTPIPITTLFTEGNFPAPTSPAAGFGAPSRVVIADINNDGRVDFVGGQSKAGSIDVFTSTGLTGKGYTPSAINLQFFSLTDANIGAAITAADLTGDGKADVAAITSDGTVLVYRGGGDGSFTRIANFTVDADAKGAPNATLGGIVAGDFNGDGTNDLIITTAGSPNASEYVVLLNNGTGATFTEVANSAKAGLSGLFSRPIAADFDGDGNLDFAAIDTRFGSGRVIVYYGGGGGGFTTTRSFFTFTTASGLAMGDFDKNGKKDLVVGSGNSVSLFLNNGASRTFVSKSNAQTANAQIKDVAAGDFNLDGFDDIAATVSGFTNDEVSVFLGSSTAATTKLVRALGNPYPTIAGTIDGIVSGDFDNNGTVDLVAGTGGVLAHQYVPFWNNTGVGGEVTLDADSTTAEFGETITFTAQAYTPASGTPIATGLFTFYEGNVALGGDILDANGDTTFTTNNLSIGKHDIVAKYTAGNFTDNMSTAFTVTVTKASTSAIVVSSVPAPVFGQPVNIITTVTGNPGQVPDGTVLFFDNGNQIGSTTLDSSGIGILAVPDFLLGSHSLQVRYLGSASFFQTISPGLELVIAKANSNTNLSAAPTTAIFGDGITLTANVAIAAPGVGAPSGTVTFFNGPVVAGTVAVANGTAKLVVPVLAVGTYTFGARYNGNIGVSESVSGTATAKINPNTSVSGITATPVTNALGTTVTLKGFVVDNQNRPVSIGTVQFRGTANGVPLTLPAVAPVNGVATFDVTGLPLGISTFDAVFSGSASITGSTSSLVSTTTVRANASTAIYNTGTSNSASLGKDITFTAAFASALNVPDAVSGSVTFKDNGKALAVVPIVDGLASFTTRLTLGTHAITAEYSGDAVYAPLVIPSNFTVTNPGDAIAVGAGAGGRDIVRLYNGDGTLRKDPLFAFGPDHTSGARVATGDVNGDGIPDLIIGTGPGTQARVRILDGTNDAPLYESFPFEDFTGGVFVSVGDVNGDLRPDIVVTPDQGGGPRVQVVSGVGFQKIVDFFGIDDVNFRGGARAAVGDLNGDGIGDLVVAAGFGGGPRVAAYDGRSLPLGTPIKLFNDFFAFEQSLRNGVYVASGDVDGDGFGDIVLGGGPGGGPRVIAISGRTLITNGATSQQLLIANFFAGDPNSRGGVPVAVANLDNDAKFDIVTGSGPGGRQVNSYLGKTLIPIGTPPAFATFDAFDENLDSSGGVFVG